MSLVRKLLSREDVLSRLVKASAEEVQANVRALDQLLTVGSPAASLRTFLQSRGRQQEIKSEIDGLLCQGSRSRLDHSDIELLARSLNRVAKGLRKFAERYLICAPRIQEVTFTQEMGMLASATQILKDMVSGVDGGLRVAAAKAKNSELEKIEAEADHLLRHKTVALYGQGQDPMRAIMLKDLYEQLDRVFERCGTAGDLVLQIVLKQS